MSSTPRPAERYVDGARNGLRDVGFERQAVAEAPLEALRPELRIRARFDQPRVDRDRSLALTSTAR